MMEEGQDINVRIEKYLLNQMEPEENLVFEQELNQDPDLREKVEIQGLIFEEVKRREDFFSIIRDIEEKTEDIDSVNIKPETITVQYAKFSSAIDSIETEKSSAGPPIFEEKSFQEYDNPVSQESRKIFPWKKVLVAAMLIGVSITVFWQPAKYSNKKIIEIYAFEIASDYPDSFMKDKRINHSFDPKEKWVEDTRSITYLFNGFDQEEILILSKSFELYIVQNYELAANEFEKIDDLTERNVHFSLIMAYSQLKSGKYEKAKSNFSKLTQDSDQSIQNEANYYLALTLIGLDDIKSARALLKTIFESKGLYSAESGEILKKMKRF